VLVAAAVALDAQKTMFQQTAIEVVLKLTANEKRQRTTTGLNSGKEGRVVPLDELVQHRLLRPVAAIGDWSASRRK
jgi:hypothetical protein